MATVRIPSVLRKHTDGAAKVTVEGATVGEVLRAVAATHPGLEEQLFDGDAVRGFINVYVDDEDIRYVSGLDSPVTPDSEVAIMPAVAGGAGGAGGTVGSPDPRDGVVGVVATA
jgi:sulfur-carrier protein